MSRATWHAAILVICPAVASASDFGGPSTPSTPSTMTRDDGLALVRQPIAATEPEDGGGVAAALAQSRVIYLNRNGIVVYPGDSDSRLDRSDVAKQQTEVPAWEVDDMMWAETVECVRALFGAYSVSVVDSDPGNVAHIEAVFGGSPTLFGLPTNVAGASPFRSDCSVIENSIVFTFTDIILQDMRLNCEIMAQEIAHSFGLDHQMLAPDVMSYLSYDDKRAFRDEASACGEFAVRPCGIDGSNCRASQNSARILGERLGYRNGLSAPSTTSSSGADEFAAGEAPTVTAGCATGSTSLGLGSALSALGLFVLGSTRRRRQK